MKSSICVCYVFQQSTQIHNNRLTIHKFSNHEKETQFSIIIKSNVKLKTLSVRLRLNVMHGLDELCCAYCGANFIEQAALHLSIGLGFCTNFLKSSTSFVGRTHLANRN